LVCELIAGVMKGKAMAFLSHLFHTQHRETCVILYGWCCDTS
jgi:hypothetical protein